MAEPSRRAGHPAAALPHLRRPGGHRRPWLELAPDGQPRRRQPGGVERGGASPRVRESDEHRPARGRSSWHFVDERLVALSRIEWMDSNDGRAFLRPQRARPSRLATTGPRPGHVRAQRRSGWPRAGRRPRAPRPRVLVTHGGAGRRGRASRSPRAEGYDRVRIYHHMVRPDMKDILLPPMRRRPRGAAAPDDQLHRALGRHDRGLPRPLRWRRHARPPPTAAGRRTPTSTSR